MSVTVVYRASEFPKLCCPFVQVNEEEKHFLVPIHTEIFEAHPISIVTA